MKIRVERGIKPALLKFGFALALSFAGFLFSHLRIRRIKPPPKSHTGNPSDHGNEVNLDGDIGEALSTRNIVSEENFLYAEETCINREISDSSLSTLCPNSNQNGDKEEFLLPEFNDLVKEVDFGATIVGNSFEKAIEVEPPRLQVGSVPEKDDYEQEASQLRNVIRMLQDREQSLEVQLLEYCGLREQEAAVVELQNRLKISNMEVKMFNLKVKMLQSENCRLMEQVADHAKVQAELETAKAKVELLNKKIRHEAEQNREHIRTLQKRVSELRDQECKDVAYDQDIQIKLQRLKGLESEVEELRKTNFELQMENSDLACRLDSTQVLANAVVLEDTDVENALVQERDRLRQENKRLVREIELLQCDRCSDLEELVYLRWVNACLRYELRNYHPQPGKTVAKELSKSLSPTSEKKAKQLILEYANTDGQGSIVNFDLDQWSFSQGSFLTDSEEISDEFSSADNSSTVRTSPTSQIKFFSKLRRLVLGKDSHHHHHQHSQVSSGNRDDRNSPQPSTSTGTEGRTSFDFSRLQSMKEGGRRYSGSMVMGLGSSNNLRNEGFLSYSLGTEKSDLEKYAEALKDSSACAKHQRRRRAASYC